MINSFVLISFITLMMFSNMFYTVELKNDFTDHYFINDYLFKQSEALIKHDVQDIGYSLHFNSKSHINKARTITINNRNIVINLDNGRIHYE